MGLTKVRSNHQLSKMCQRLKITMSIKKQPSEILNNLQENTECRHLKHFCKKMLQAGLHRLKINLRRYKLMIITNLWKAKDLISISLQSPAMKTFKKEKGGFYSPINSLAIKSKLACTVSITLEQFANLTRLLKPLIFIAPLKKNNKEALEFFRFHCLLKSSKVIPFSL